MRFIYAFAFLALWLQACGGAEEGTGAESEASGDAISENAAVALTVSALSDVREYQDVTLRVEAIDAQGQRDESYYGEVSIVVSRGQFSVSIGQIEAGVGEVTGYFDREGMVLMDIASDGMVGQGSFPVAAATWIRGPTEWVMSGVVNELNHWTFGGFWDGSIVPHEGEWVGFFLASNSPGLDGNPPAVMSRLVSSDEGASWELDPEEPVLDETRGGSVFLQEDGTWVLWSLGEADRTLSRFTSNDLGKTWTPTDCSVSLGNSVWNAGGVESPSAWESTDGSVRVWFTGADSNTPPRRVIGLIQGSCGGEWGNPVVAIGMGSTGAWNESSVSSPVVWREGSTWKMMGAGRTSGTAPPSLGYWTSDDGLVWDESPGNPVVSRTIGVGTWDARGIDFPAIILPEGAKPTLFFSGIPSDWRPRMVRAAP